MKRLQARQTEGRLDQLSDQLAKLRFEVNSVNKQPTPQTARYYDHPFGEDRYRDGRSYSSGRDNGGGYSSGREGGRYAGRDRGYSPGWNGGYSDGATAQRQDDYRRTRSPSPRRRQYSPSPHRYSSGGEYQAAYRGRDNYRDDTGGHYPSRYDTSPYRGHAANEVARDYRRPSPTRRVRFDPDQVSGDAHQGNEC